MCVIFKLFLIRCHPVASTVEYKMAQIVGSQGILDLSCPPVNENVTRKAKMFKVRWDKGDLADYYRISGYLLHYQH